MSSKFLKTLAAKNILVPHINQYLERGSFPEVWNLTVHPNKAPDSFFHPSSDCTPCVSELYAKFTNQLDRRPITAVSQKNFNVGHFWHIWLQTILVDGLGFADWQAVERHVSHEVPEWKAVGFADLAPCSVPGRGEYLVDFKTMNSRYFKMTAQDPQLAWIIEKWKHQVMCYMAWTGLEKTIIVGIQKDTPHDFREFIIDYDQTIVDKTYEKWYSVSQALVSGIPPQCSCEDCPVSEYDLSGH